MAIRTPQQIKNESRHTKLIKILNENFDKNIDENGGKFTLSKEYAVNDFSFIKEYFKEYGWEVTKIEKEADDNFLDVKKITEDHIDVHKRNGEVL